MEFLNFPEIIPQNQEEEFPEFVIDNDNKADWAIRKIAEQRKETARLLDLVKEKKAELEWIEKAIKEKDEANNRYFSMKLENYFDTVDHKETKTQETYALLAGKLIRKKAIDKPVCDTEALLTYLEDNDMGDFIKVERTAKWGDFKKNLTFEDGNAVTADGEVLDFITFEHKDAEFEVKI